MKNTTDLWFSAFLMLRNVKLEKYDVISKGKGRYYFDISDEAWVTYKLEFNNSDVVKYKTLIEQLKDLLY